MPDAGDGWRGIVETAAARGLTLAVAESLTGGLVCGAITAVAGSSAVLVGGVVAYDTAVKRALLGVDGALLDRQGPVHPDVAAEMAQGVRTALRVPAALGLATTGVAGPGAQDGTAAGTVFIALASETGTTVRGLALTGDRAGVRADTVAACEVLLRDFLAG